MPRSLADFSLRSTIASIFVVSAVYAVLHSSAQTENLRKNIAIHQHIIQLSISSILIFIFVLYINTLDLISKLPFQ